MGSKYGTAYAIASIYDGTTSTREVIDWTDPDYSTAVSTLTYTSAQYPQTIGFPITYNDIMAELKPFDPKYQLENIFFTIDEFGGNINTFKFTDGSIIDSITNSPLVSKRCYSYEQLIATDMVITGCDGGVVILLDILNLQILWDIDYAPSDSDIQLF